MAVVASLSQGRTAAAQCGLFTYKSVPVIFEPPCIYGIPKNVKKTNSRLKYYSLSLSNFTINIYDHFPVIRIEPIVFKKRHYTKYV